MGIFEALNRFGRDVHGEMQRIGDHLVVELTLAQRKTPFMLQQLRYRLDIEVDEGDHAVLALESLWERGHKPKGHLDLGPNLAWRDEPFQVEDGFAGADLDGQVRVFANHYPKMTALNPLREKLRWAVKRSGYTLRNVTPM
jgi:hypothetical protein